VVKRQTWLDVDHRLGRLSQTAPAAHPRPMGQIDPSFQVGEVAALERELPEAEVHILDAGHFALYEKPDEVAVS
jgi:hypothetical protein